MSLLHTVLRVFLFIPLLIFRAVSQAFKFVLTKATKAIFKQTIVFNCVWEDPRLDKEALEIVKDETVICTITSAGCNVLSLALEEPKHIYSIDMNPCQNALLELKIAAIRELEYEQFWQMFGKGYLKDFSKVWYPRLRQHLSRPSCQFWDTHSYYFDGNGWFGRKSFYFYGSAGILAWFMTKIYFRLIPGLNTAMNDLIHAESLKEQRRIYTERVEKKLWNRFIMWFCSSKTALALLNGVPSEQQKLLEEDSGYDSVIDFIRTNLAYVLTELPLKDNYFWRVYVENGQYTRDCCPDYLIEDNFEALRNGLIDRISIHTESIEQCMDKGNESKEVDRFILLDHMDWMSIRPKMLASEWRSLLSNASPGGCKFLWRSASKDSQFVLDTKVQWQGKDTTVGDILQFRPELAEKLHKLDRVHTYTSFHIGDLIFS